MERDIWKKLKTDVNTTGLPNRCFYEEYIIIRSLWNCNDLKDYMNESSCSPRCRYFHAVKNTPTDVSKENLFETNSTTKILK